MLRLFVSIRFLHIHFHLNRSQNARHMIFSLIAVRVVVVVISTSQCCKNFLNAKRKWNCILNATCRLNFYYISWGSSWSVNTHATKYKKKGLCVTIFFVRTIMLLKSTRGALIYSMKTFQWKANDPVSHSGIEVIRNWKLTYKYFGWISIS